ncbi:MAG: Crp/Fnr family transcriptional regulator [Sulfuritalea sp.]|jgi:CRP-like cAMP-binding protein|uniref:Crp/Fnr family transcriptional regulator n=2 Tax=Sulfuritalea hydrogenivorans TaxID=748811 RepID=W0SCJ8_9PROT|nr:Crp/Fnr family transcriptional regulator [Sulfuritalea sp.]BAO28657.1 Crp/Fnr family transcriptional regulator [Sulfuritalea hydrogenivorans sk43H]
MHETKLDIPQILSRLPLFQELVPEQIAVLEAACRERRLAKGEMLFQKGDPPKGFFVVVFGQIKLAFPSSQGNEKVVQILGPRQSFGEAVMFMDRPYPLFAEGLVDSLLLHIGSTTVFELLERDPLFARRMLAGLSMRLHSLVHDVETYSLRSSAQRVVGYLLQHCPQQDGPCEGSFNISLPTSKQVIASRLNLTPETLSRIFHDLSTDGLINVSGKQITINDVKRLREFDL